MTEEIQSSLTESGQKRREAVWAVCDRLSEQGAKPSLRSVKIHYPRGSDPDVQRDVNAWFDYVFAAHHQRKVIPTLPDEVVRAVEGLWELATKLARANFAKSEEESQHRVEMAEQELAELRTSLHEVKRQKVDLERANDELTSVLRSKETQLEELRTDRSEALRDLALLRDSAARRETELLGEMKRQQERAESTASQQRADFDSQLQALRADHENRLVDHRTQLARADAHYRDLERHALQEVDSVRTRLKATEEAAERSRLRASEFEVECATIRSEYRVFKEMSQKQITTLDRQIAALMAEVETLRQGASLREDVPPAPKLEG